VGTTISLAKGNNQAFGQVSSRNFPKIAQENVSHITNVHIQLLYTYM